MTSSGEVQAFLFCADGPFQLQQAGESPGSELERRPRSSRTGERALPSVLRPQLLTTDTGAEVCALFPSEPTGRFRCRAPNASRKSLLTLRQKALLYSSWGAGPWGPSLGPGLPSPRVGAGGPARSNDPGPSQGYWPDLLSSLWYLGLGTQLPTVSGAAPWPPTSEPHPLPLVAMPDWDGKGLLPCRVLT